MTYAADASLGASVVWNGSAYAAAWEWEGPDSPPTLHKEQLEFEYVHLAQRSYK